MIDFSQLDDAELVDQLRTSERLIAAATAKQLAAIAELHTRTHAWITDPDPHRAWVQPIEVTAAEIAPALAISTSSATDRVDLALTLATRLRLTWAALRVGDLSPAKARIIAERTAVLDDTAAAAVEARVLPRAGKQTPAALGAALARAVIAADPTAAERRRSQATRDRRVDLYPCPDGMAALRALLPAADALSAYQHLTAAAEAAAVDGDDRGIDARRADALLDLIRRTRSDDAEPDHGDSAAAQLAQTPTDRTHPGPRPGRRTARRRRRSRPASVHLTAPFAVLAGLSEDPALLAGYGPITAGAARELAADATWRRILTDPISGTVLDVGRTSYPPPAGLADHVRTRDGTCRFPGCRQPAGRTDLDHTIPYPHGSTAATNLAALCRAHHRLKTFTTWTVDQTGDGTLTWTSPTGQRHTTRPRAHPVEHADAEADTAADPPF